MKKFVCNTTISLILSLFTLSGFAQFWKDVGNVVTGGLNVVKQTVTAPTQVVVNSVQAATGNGSVSNIYQPIVQLAQTSGNTVVDATRVANSPQALLTQQAQQFASNVGGKPGEFIFDVGTFMQKYSTGLSSTGVQIANNVLNGQNPFQVVGAPLAAAIHAAHDEYASKAQPIPADVKQALQGYFDQNILDRAMYAIGSVEITLPNLIIQSRKLFGGEDYAVTVDNIIVFPKNPGGYSQSCEWWAHELTHVRQYAQWGVELFAYNYVRDHNGVENEAINNATTITHGNWCFSQQQRTEYMQLVSQRENDAAVRSLNSSSAGYIPSVLNFNETYVAQCVLPQNPMGAMFLVTNQGRIIAINPSNGQSMHVGFSNPPRLPNVAWSFDLPAQNWRFAVMPNGAICNPSGPIFNNFGQIIGYQLCNQVGYVQSL
jgi:hypothetical protein